MSLVETIKYQDPRRILVVGTKGAIRELHCPFRVQCIEGLDHVPLNSWVYVDGVFLHRKHRILYHINQRFYPYHFFRIELHY